MELIKHKPSIISGIGIGCLLSSIFAAWKFSPLAQEAIDERKRELDVDKLDIVERLKISAPYVIPTAALAVTGCVCVCVSDGIDLQRQAGAATALAIEETTSRIYRDKVKEVVGDRKEKEIQEAVAKETYQQDYNNGKIMVISGNSNGFSMYDGLTKQKFKSNIEKVHSVINNLNRRMLTSDITIDDYCLAMGEYPMELGKNFGWNIDRGFIELEPFTAIVDEDGEPVIVITHRIPPRELY
jgi:hypothetical protein